MARRLAAAIVALSAWTGLILQTIASTDKTGNMLAALWVMAGFFTILTNLGVAVIFTGIAWGQARFARPAWVGGAVICILLVGIVYAVMLQDIEHLTGLDQAANILNHRVTPIVATLWWLAFARPGLRWSDPPRWAAIPLAYLVYAIIRGTAQGHYAYPFLDGGKLGWSTVVITVLIMSAGFMVGGWAMVALDRALAWRR